MASGLTGAQRNDVHEKILPVLTTSPSRRLRYVSPCRNTDQIDSMVHFLTSLEDCATPLNEAIDAVSAADPVTTAATPNATGPIAASHARTLFSAQHPGTDDLRSSASPADG
jgi:hypothetical protein